MKNVWKLMLSVCVIVAAGCGAESTNDSKSTKSTENAQNQAFSQLISQEKPANAVTVTALKKTAKVGDKVTFYGQIGGVPAPFVEGRAMMVVADHTQLKACADTCGGCPTPWDFCCEPSDKRQAHTLTVQFLDDNGQLVRESFETLAGVKGNAIAYFTGLVAEGSTDTLMTVNLSELYVLPAP